MNNVNLPGSGGFYFHGPRPTSVSVREVPPGVGEADLQDLVTSLCGTREGLQLEGPELGVYSVNYRELVRLAHRLGIRVPVGVAAPRLQERRFSLHGELNDTGQPIGPMRAPRRARQEMRLDGNVVEVM